MREGPNLSSSALAVYEVFDDLVNNDWSAVLSFDKHVRPIAHMLPPQPWRPLWHEISSQRLIAHSVRNHVECISRWRNRFSIDHLLSQRTYAVIAKHYTDWTPFSLDGLNDVLIDAQIHTEALFQVNSAFSRLCKAGVLELRNMGTEVRCTKETIDWVFK